MKISKIIAASAAAAALLTGCANSSDSSVNNNSDSSVTNDSSSSSQPDSGNIPGASEIRDMTTAEIVHDMGIGINLGNTFESCGGWIDNSSVTNFETGWGSPVITEDIIKGYADAGFGVLRVPVAWSNMMDADTYKIDQSYIDRVKEVVTWAINDNMYVILNI